MSPTPDLSAFSFPTQEATTVNGSLSLFLKTVCGCVFSDSYEGPGEMEQTGIAPREVFCKSTRSWVKENRQIRIF